MRRVAAAGLALAFWAGAPGAQEFNTLKGHGGPVMALAVSPSGQVATASFDNSAGLWTGRSPQWLEGHDAAVTALAFAGPKRLVTAGDDFAVQLWENGEARLLGRHQGKVRGLTVSPDGTSVASASWDGTIGLWRLDGSGQELLTLGTGVNDVAYAPDGRLFAATMDGQLLAFADPGGTPRIAAQHGFGINRLAMAADGAWLAYGAVDGATRVIDPETGAEIADFTLDRRPILALDHHPGTGQLAVGDGQGYIMVVDTADWSIARDFRATREGPVWALAFSSDGGTLWASGLDDVAYGWPVAMMDEFDPAIGQERPFLRPPETMPNGERQFMRKCSICHALTPGGSRKAGPSLHGLFGRRAGTLPGYRYSQVLDQSDIIWTDDTVDALFDLGPDHFIPGSKMPMQRIAAGQDRRDLIEFLKHATEPEN